MTGGSLGGLTQAATPAEAHPFNRGPRTIDKQTMPMSDERSWALHFSRQSALEQRHADRQGPWCRTPPSPWPRSTLIARRLEARAIAKPDLDRVWREEWSAGRPIASPRSPTRPAAEGRQITAGNHYMRAGQLLLQRGAVHPAGPEKMERVSQGAALLSRGDGAPPPGDRSASRCPTRMPACRPISSRAAAAAARPTVVLFDGMDNAKEDERDLRGPSISPKRGQSNTLAIDGAPARPRALRLRNIHSRHDYEVPGTAAYEYVAARPRGSIPSAVAVMGYSFGGYQAPPHRRLREALCRRGSVRGDALEHLRVGRGQQGQARGRSAHQLHIDLPVPLGGGRARQRDRASNGRRSSRSKGSRRISKCAFLVPAWRERTGSSRLEAAQTLYERVGSKRKQIRIFTAAEGAAEHCQVRSSPIGASTISATGCSANM